MSKRHYPRFGTGGVIPRNSACKLCGTTEKVRALVVQVNWFRGDDDVHPVCAKCRSAGAWPDAALLERLGYRGQAEGGAGGTDGDGGEGVG